MAFPTPNAFSRHGYMTFIPLAMERKFSTLRQNIWASLNNGIEHIKTLEVLNLYYNSIEDLFEIKRLQCNPNLRDLDLRLNPISRLTADYRRYLSYLLPKLKTLDCRPLRRTESPPEDLLPSSNEEHNNYPKNERNCTQWSTGNTGERFHFGGWKQELLRESSEQIETPLRSRSYADLQKSAKWSHNNTKIFPPEESPKITSFTGVSPCWLDDHVEKQRSALVEYYSSKGAFPNELESPGANETRVHTEDTYTNHKERAEKASKDAKSNDSIPNSRKTGDSGTYSGSSVTASARESAPKALELPIGKMDLQERQLKENYPSPSGYAKIDQPFLIALKANPLGLTTSFVLLLSWSEHLYVNPRRQPRAPRNQYSGNGRANCPSLSILLRLCTSGDLEAAVAGLSGVGVVLSHWVKRSLLEWMSADSRLFMVCLAISVKEFHKREIDRGPFVVYLYMQTDCSSDTIKDKFYVNFVMDSIMRQTLESRQNAHVRIAADESLVDLEYADDVVLAFEEDKKDELTEAKSSLAPASHQQSVRSCC
ncbi:centrosomal protein of 72 kDa [Clonorchis sinensis]|uniref:Centrosomal protein of 72 kDa n=1 Tax=Clonorchis sinensis TaxID=79923 RepID=H2KTP7_CLOSI|nr:centrosomal protein of 72 kDa [Clonorchis sinensis]